MNDSLNDAWKRVRPKVPAKPQGEQGLTPSRPTAWAALFWDDGSHVERELAMTFPEVLASSYARVPVDPLMQVDGAYTIHASFESREIWPNLAALGLYTTPQGGELFYARIFDGQVNLHPGTVLDLTIQIHDVTGSLVGWKTLLRAVGIL